MYCLEFIQSLKQRDYNVLQIPKRNRKSRSFFFTIMILAQTDSFKIILNLEMTSKEILILETIKGEIEVNNIPKDGIVLFHQRLVPNVFPTSCDRPITLQHLEYHRSNLLSLENTSLTSGMIQHEIQTLMQRSGRSSTNVIILDGSNYESKVPQLFERYTVVKGYQYKLAGNPPESQKVVLLSKEHIIKQLQYQFKLGNGKFKPGFIGQLALEDCLLGSSYFNAYKSYLQFSAKTNCLIIINSLELGQRATYHYLKCSSNQISNPYYSFSSNVLKKVEFALSDARDSNAKRVVLYNIPFVFQTSVDEGSNQIITNTTHHSITEIIRQYDCYLGFDLSRYSQSKEALYYIGLLIKAFSNRIILSGGLTYKTDLTLCGGSGYMYYKGDKLDEISLIAGQKHIFNALFLNKVQLLSWKVKVQEIKIVVLWKCNECSGQQPETIQSFRKFGKQFCSIKCLKSHKF